MDLALTGRTALVTGSHRGTGEVIAQTLAREGARVIFHSNEANAADSAAAATDNACAVWGDLCTDAGADQCLAQLPPEFKHIDILVNNYGTAARGKWATASEADWLDMYQRNVLSAARMAQRLFPAMQQRGWGRIVQLGTIGSHQPNNIMPHYYAAKGALATMSVSLAKELSHSGITVNTISPGYIRTPELEAMYRQKANKQSWGEDWAQIEQQIVANDFPNHCGRIAERQEVADLVAFICSERAGFINGQNIRIDGGAVAYV